MRLHFHPGSRCVWKPHSGFEMDGNDIHVIGVNYVARHVCTNFWEDWRQDIVEKDMDAIAETGLNSIRIPIHWDYFEPLRGTFRNEALECLDLFVEMAAERGLLIMPWFLVGVATMDYDVSWRNGESFFGPMMTEAAENHLKTVAGRLTRHPNILCWDICDEPEWYSRHPGADKLPYDKDRFHLWCGRMLKALKGVDSQRAVTLGFGHIACGNYGMDLRRAAQDLDLMAVTAYPPHVGEDLVNGFRSGHFLGWSVRFNDCAEKGVFTCEAPGWSDIEASEENIGAFFRVCLFSNLANGSHGVMPWVWNDFDDALQALPPMDKYTSEKRFGITYDGTRLKPAGRELRRFAEFTEEFPPSKWPTLVPEVQVLVPLQRPIDAHGEFASLFHHYMLLRQAGLRIRYLWADDLDTLEEGKPLFLPDSVEIPLRTDTWLKLLSWVERGGTLISTSRHCSSVFNRLFGVEVEGTLREPEETVFAHCEGEFAPCSEIALPGGCQLRLVRPASAQPLCADVKGRPLLVRNALGAGRAIFIAYPPEQALSHMRPESLGAHKMHCVIRLCVKDACPEPPISCYDPRVEFDLRRHADGRLLAIMINHSRFPVRTSLSNGYQAELTANDVQWRTFN